jgi:hypothetical protein
MISLVMWRRRQNELAKGFEAERVRENRWRFKVAFASMSGGLINLLISRVQIPVTFRKILVLVPGLLLLVGFIFATWARAEESFLSSADPMNLRS